MAVAEPVPTTRAQILEAAVRLFGERGYDKVSVRELAGAAGCSPANLYHHFRSKYDIFATIIEEAMDRHVEGLQEALRQHDDPVLQLRHVLENHLRLHVERADVRLLRDDFHPLRGAERDRFIAERDEYERGVRAVVQRARDGGRLTPGDVKLSVMVALAAASQVDRWYRPDGELPSSELVRRIADFLMAGFGSAGV